MLPKTLCGILLVCLLAASCGHLDQSASSSKDSGHAPGMGPRKSLAGVSYLFSTELDSTTCTANRDCDCCGENILFLTDSSLISINYCETNVSYSAGRYYFDGTTLEIFQDSITLVRRAEIPDESAGTGHGPLLFHYDGDTVRTQQETYEWKKCGAAMIFQGATAYGSPDTAGGVSSFAGLLWDMAVDSTWELLKKANKFLDPSLERMAHSAMIQSIQGPWTDNGKRPTLDIRKDSILYAGEPRAFPYQLQGNKMVIHYPDFTRRGRIRFFRDTLYIDYNDSTAKLWRFVRKNL
jgi:hypothetical protein